MGATAHSPQVDPGLKAALADRYSIEREIGRGGHAVVYLARDSRHNREVAIKVVRQELSDSLRAERFLEEIQMVAKLAHPHILPLYDSGDAAGCLYYVMPFMTGESLRARLVREKQLSLEEALRITTEVADALGYAHQHAIVHRDIKPENILLQAGHALVADFGIARAVSVAHGSRTGLVAGTPEYMSPEQAADEAVDGRSDLYSLGCVLYEMLAGHPPFTGDTAQEVLARHAMDTAPSVRAACPDIAPATEQAVRKVLSKRRSDRFGSAAEFVRALNGAPLRPARRLRRKTAVLVVLAVLVASLAWLARRSWGAPRHDATWVRTIAIPQIMRLAEDGKSDSAWTMARAAQQTNPHDSALAAVWPHIANHVTIETDPPGVRVYRNSYTADQPWDYLGTTPLHDIWIPVLLSRLRYEKEGYETAEFVSQQPLINITRMELRPRGTVPAGMVYVPPGWSQVSTVTRDVPRLELNEYFIDKYEVTNAQFKRFVLGGGYRDPRYWQEPFIRHGALVPWREAMGQFVDRTGRPGSASWEGGDYPQGQANDPVGGLSWFEAAAYARFAGKSLPTIYHWDKAAGRPNSAWIVPLSNFSDSGPAPVGSHLGINRFGTYDMAGNVREWCSTANGAERYIMGGGWNDADYIFNRPFSADPWDRSPTNGMRLVQYIDPRDPGTTAAPLPLLQRNFSAERPVSDQVFRIYQRLFQYDSLPLAATVDTIDSTSADWVRQRVSFAAAYADERIPAYLFLPRHAKAPYQAVVFFPGSTAFWSRSSRYIVISDFDFIVKSGRAVIVPIYKDTYERGGADLKTDVPDQTNLFKEHVIMWAKDLRRAVDYVATRSDLDLRKLAYYGHSWGGRNAPVMIATEPRIKVAVLNIAGFRSERAQPEVEPFNYAPRVRIPVLVLSGRYDALFPLESSALPFFRSLGTPPEHKRQVVSDGGHFVPRPQLIRETLDWLDRYMGPVTATP